RLPVIGTESEETGSAARPRRMRAEALVGAPQAQPHALEQPVLLADVVVHQAFVLPGHRREAEAGQVEVIRDPVEARFGARPDDLAGAGELELEADLLRAPGRRIGELAQINAGAADVDRLGSVGLFLDVLV